MIAQCYVCHAASESPGPCPNCGFDARAGSAATTDAIVRAREAWRLRTLAFAPAASVRAFDRLKPWLGAALGVVLFLFWVRACSGSVW